MRETFTSTWRNFAGEKRGKVSERELVEERIIVIEQQFCNQKQIVLTNIEYS
jgi:hypothetical protein